MRILIALYFAIIVSGCAAAEEKLSAPTYIVCSAPPIIYRFAIPIAAMTFPRKSAKMHIALSIESYIINPNVRYWINKLPLENDITA